MDDIVKRAMLKWPDVPNVYGWLRLDCRGDWQLRMSEGVFDRIRNPGIVEFINRNYHCDQRGCWFFQNGPQRVFVGLDCTPLVYRLDDRRAGWLAHTGERAALPSELLLAEDESMMLVTTLGVGVILDRDLEFVLDHLQDVAGGVLDAEIFLQRAQAGPQAVQLAGATLRVSQIKKAQLAKRFGFEPEPAAEGGLVPARA